LNLQPALAISVKSFFGSKPVSLGEETKHDAIEKAGDAQVFLLRHLQLAPAFGVFKFDALPSLKRLGDGGNFFRQLFGDSRGCSLRAKIIRIFVKSAAASEIFRIVNLSLVNS
jgi:hypothetical protein